MGGIFLSYRREDSAGWTGRLSEHLKERFGPNSIFIDIDTIEPGADFTEALQKAVSACDVLLAIIGPDWVTATDTSGKPRLDDPNDWVRVEITAALKRKIRVIPVLVGGASVPTKNLLPDELAALAQRQAHELTDKRWSYDVEQLVNTLPATRPILSAYPNVTPTVSNARRLTPALIGVVVLVIAISAWVAMRSILPSTTSQDDIHRTIELPQAGSPQQPPTNLDLAQLKPIAASKPVLLRAGQEARLKNKFIDYRYRVLTAELQHQNPSTNLLRLHIRFTNDGWPGANFWNDTFRLLVDSVPRAPIGDLNEVVEPHSAKEGVVEFTVPAIITQVTLQMRSGEEVTEIPINLTDNDADPKPSPAARQQATLLALKLPIALPAGQTVQLKDHRAARVYTLLSGQIDRRNTESLFLTLKIRVLNNGPMDAEFGSDNFRLLVDSIPRAPSNFLNDLVDQHSAKEGTVEFSFPITTEGLILQIRVGQETADIPLDLKVVSP